MVAANIQVLASGDDATAAPADRIRASSQGVLIAVMSVFHLAPNAQGFRIASALLSWKWTKSCGLLTPLMLTRALLCSR